jgi:predicted transcriptional regulator
MNKKRQKYIKEYQRQKRDEIASIPDNNKVKCLICGKYYVQVGSHIVQSHGITAREYREQFKLEVKKGIVPKWYREMKGEQCIENGTVENLKKGKKFRFVKGQKGPGIYKRSEITIARLREQIKNIRKIKKND